MIGMRKLGMAECGKHSDKAFCKVILDQDQEPKLSSHSVRRVSAIEDFAPPPQNTKSGEVGTRNASKANHIECIEYWTIESCSVNVYGPPDRAAPPASNC